MSSTLELEDDEFERLILDRRHKELLAAINKLLMSVKSDNGVSAALTAQAQAIQEFKFAIQSIKQPDVIVNQEPVLAAVKGVSADIKNGVEELKALITSTEDCEEEWSFDIIRDFTGSIVKVNAKQK